MSIVPANTADGAGPIAAPGSPTYAPVPEGAKQPRRFDLCMIFKCKTSKNVKFEETNEDMMGNRALQQPTPQQEFAMKAWRSKREELLKQMKNVGLRLYCFYTRDRDEIVCKIGADAEKLGATAARLKYKLQLKQEYLGAYAEYRQDFPGRPDRGYRDRKLYSHLYERHADDDSLDDAAIFTTRDKIFLVNHIVQSKDKDCAGINIGNLFHGRGGEEALITNYFPLHEDSKLEDLKRNPLDWIKMGTDHAHKVRDYFGDKVCYYYLFMSFYAVWLIIPAIIGVVLQLVDWMWRTPDNFTAVPFCIFVSVWALFLPHFWRRQEAKYSISWGTFDLVPELEPPRPAHWGEPKINPVTAQVENYYPWQKRMGRYVFSSICVVVTGICVVGVILGILFARHMLKNKVWGGIAMWQFIMALIVELVNKLLTEVAKMLTEYENHRTQTEHETHLLAKVFAFKFVNSYFAMYYIAFFKKHMPLFGTPMHCLRDDCWLDLQLALAIFFLVRMVVQNSVAYVWPKIRFWWKGATSEGRAFFHNLVHSSRKLELADMSAAEQQCRREPYDAFMDFDETLITHGYATLFSVTSPWVCFATLAWVILEIYLDVKGLTETTQRPMPRRMRNNEPWDSAFDIYGVLAAVTNITLLLFSSEIYEGWSAASKLVLFLVVAHATFLSKLVVQWVFPAVPNSVELLNLRQGTMVHRCLENIKVEPEQDFNMHHTGGKGGDAEVLEQDIFDEQHGEELEMSTAMCKDSIKVMCKGMYETMDRGLICVMLLALVLVAIVSITLFIINYQNYKKYNKSVD